MPGKIGEKGRDVLAAIRQVGGSCRTVIVLLVENPEELLQQLERGGANHADKGEVGGFRQDQFTTADMVVNILRPLAN